MKILLLGPLQNPLVRRLRGSLLAKGINVISASFDMQDDFTNNVYSLGKLKGMKSYLYSSRLKKIINEHNPDLIHAHVCNHYALLTLSIKKTIPVFTTLWGSDVMLASKSSNIIKNYIFRLLNLLVYRRSSLIHSSSLHVINELIRQVGCFVQYDKKLFEQYWGMPLSKLSAVSNNELKCLLADEFGEDIKSADKLIVFPRGIKDIYNPELVLEIINRWGEVNSKRILVLFKAFSSDILWAEFKNKVKNVNCVFIDRLLSDQELSFFYSSSLAHVSVAFSDNLGGGVIEPMQMGSIPILSDIDAYQPLKKMAKAIFISRDCDVLKQIHEVEIISGSCVNNENDKYSNPEVKIIEMYNVIANV